MKYVDNNAKIGRDLLVHAAGGCLYTVTHAIIVTLVAVAVLKLLGVL